MMMKLQQALDWIQARQPSARLVGEGHTPVQRVHTDSRSLQAGDLFVALQGERFDAHDFLPQARQAGACAAVARGGLQAAGLPGIEVPDTLAALGALAAGWRSQFTLPLIAVTGSNGKTTVTQMLASILRAQAGEGAFATQGNLNNAIGVPQTLLRLRAAHRMGVVELGMNHPGEIAGLADMARPTVALVNNAQREHLEFMHTVQAVAEENGAVLAALPPDGVAVFPGDDAFTPLWRALAGTRRCLCFGAAPAAQAEPTQAPAVQVWCEQAQWQGDAWALRIATPGGHFATRLQVAGRHNVRNALAATACALAAGCTLAAVAEGLAAFVPVAGRSRVLALPMPGRTLTVVDDCYNANPDSMQAAIAVLAELPAPRWLVLGDMGEVGSQGPQFHAEAGALARASGIEHLLALGTLSTHAVQAFAHASGPTPAAQARHFDDKAALLAALRAALPGMGSVLVKGSRFMKMEDAVQALQEAACS